MEEIYRKSGQEYSIYLAENFLDEAREWVTSLRKGTRFNGSKFTWSKEHKNEDQSSMSVKITFKEVGKALNGLSNYLQFSLCDTCYKMNFPEECPIFP